jgi:hypothetical protein
MHRAGEKAQMVKVFVTKPNILSSIPRTHTVEGGTHVWQAVLWPPHMHWSKNTSSHTDTKCLSKYRMHKKPLIEVELQLWHQLVDTTATFLWEASTWVSKLLQIARSCKKTLKRTQGLDLPQGVGGHIQGWVMDETRKRISPEWRPIRMQSWWTS